MARWRLIEPHYVYGRYPHSEATEWEHREVDRLSGRELRKRYKVPAYFDKDTIVCHEGKGDRDDCVFEGDPTSAMDPIDDEARAITERCRPSWGDHPIDSLRGQGLEDRIAREATSPEALKAAAAAAMSEAKRELVSKSDYDALLARLAKLEAERPEKRRA